MKKIFTISLCVILILSLLGCGNSTPVEINGDQNGTEYETNGENQDNGQTENGDYPNGDYTDYNGEQYEDISDINGDTNENNGELQNDEPTENNDNQDNSGANAGATYVEINITPWLVNFLYEFVGMSPHELRPETEFVTASMNQNGSFTATMQRERHEQTMTELRRNLGETLSGLAGNPLMPHVRSVTGSSDFRNVTVEVDRVAYENAGFELAHMVIGMSVLVYQMFGGQEGHVTMQFRDADNGNLISTYIFPN